MPYPHLSVALLRFLTAGFAFPLMTACAATPTETPPPPTVATASLPVIVPPASTAALTVPVPDFAEWRAAFRAEALAAGIAPAVFDHAFEGITPDPAVVAADHSQPEFTRPVWEYLDGALSGPRVSQGQRLLREHAEVLQAIEARYGVDRQALVAIWGLESNFGQTMGDKSVIRSLATLAHEGRRPEFARSQLLAALLILQSGDIQPERMRGSWAGAIGQTQFIPSTYNDYAVDFDGDGRRDVWDTPADALASAAHYLQLSGWIPGQPWGFEVQVPAGFDWSLADSSVRKPLSAWRDLGIGGIPGGRDGDSAYLLLPAGHRGPAFLVLNNFRMILRYNNSSSYALAIGLLGERFAGGGRVQGDWPRGERPLSRTERLELQERLVGLGFELGTPDSIIGTNTRKAVRAYQQRLGWPADGYASVELLEQLRKETL